MHKNSKSATYLLITAAILIPTTLFHTNVTAAKIIFMLAVYVSLFSVWLGARRIDKQNSILAASLSEAQGEEFAQIRLQFSMMTSTAIAGIALAVAVGRLIGTVHHH